MKCSTLWNMKRRQIAAMKDFFLAKHFMGEARFIHRR